MKKGLLIFIAAVLIMTGCGKEADNADRDHNSNHSVSVSELSDVVHTAERPETVATERHETKETEEIITEEPETAQEAFYEEMDTIAVWVPVVPVVEPTVYQDTNDTILEEESDEPDTDNSDPVADPGYTGGDTAEGLTDEEIWQIGRIVELEVGICSWYTRYLTACVLLNRMYDWPECSDIYDVIWEPGQYATANRYTDWDGNALVISETTWDAVYSAIADTDRNPHFQCSYAPGFSLYYLDEEYGVYFYY